MKSISILIIPILFSSFSLAARAKPLVIGVIGDLNGTECQNKYPANSITAFGQMLTNHSLDQIIMTGDAVHGECLRYRGNTPYERVVGSMWEEFDEHFFRRANTAKGLSPILSAGNHDAPYLSQGSRETFRVENAEFKRYWLGLKSRLNVEPIQLPEAHDNYPYYWAYTHENVLFVVLHNTRTHTLADGVEQKKWLRALLRSPQALGARARIAFGHVPPYPVLDPGVGGKYNEILDQEQVGKPNGLVDLLLDYGVDLLLVGHSHAPYPAELTRLTDQKRMKILSMPCAHAPRKLYSKKVAAPRGYALVEISEENKISLSVRNWSDGTPLPPEYFPVSIPLRDKKVSYRRLDPKVD